MAAQSHEADDLDFLLRSALCDDTAVPSEPERVWSGVLARIADQPPATQPSGLAWRVWLRSLAQIADRWPAKQVSGTSWRLWLRLLARIESWRLRSTHEVAGGQIPCEWLLGCRMMSLAQAVG